MGAYVVAGDAQGDAVEVHVEQGQLTGAEVVARGLTEALGGKGLEGEGKLVDPAGGLHEVAALTDQARGVELGGQHTARPLGEVARHRSHRVRSHERRAALVSYVRPQHQRQQALLR